MLFQITSPVGDLKAKPEYKLRNQPSDVRTVQRLLTIAANSLLKPEYYPGEIDGRYGPATQRAIVAFQRSFWSNPDGLIEPPKNQTNTFTRLVDVAAKVPLPRDNQKLDTLNADFRVKASVVINRMRDLGWHLRIVYGKRTKAENDALVAKGTASRSSKHLDGLAVDLIDTRVAYSNDRTHRYYKNLQTICQEVGLTWGGNFSSRWDPTHFEEKGVPVGAASQLPGNTASC